jgi:hypothetical protein
VMLGDPTVRSINAVSLTCSTARSLAPFVS